MNDHRDATHLPDDDPNVDDTALDDTALDRALAEPLEPLGEQLRALLDPSDGLSQRTVLDVDRTLRSRSTLSTGLDLLGLGWWTAKALLTDDPLRADGEGEGI